MALQLSSKIADAFDNVRRSPAAELDQWGSGGREQFQNLVAGHIKSGRPIPFVLPAFPFKSQNTKTKVSGALPDKGERLALETLSNFAKEVRAIYPPGANILVISDGYVFNDIYEIDVSSDNLWPRISIVQHFVFRMKNVKATELLCWIWPRTWM